MLSLHDIVVGIGAVTLLIEGKLLVCLHAEV